VIPAVWRVSDEALKYYRQDGSLYISGQLKVLAVVRNLAPEKTVSIRYTTDNWASWKESAGVWSGHSDTDNTDQFLIHTESTLPPGCVVRYAIRYVVGGSCYWDNNRSVNYTVQF
jgi:protein phosphatase 1 regulatory subunit 3A/B/C/D/E